MNKIGTNTIEIGTNTMSTLQNTKTTTPAPEGLRLKQIIKRAALNTSKSTSSLSSLSSTSSLSRNSPFTPSPLTVMSKDEES